MIPQRYAAGAKYLALGFEFAATVLASLFAGYYADDWLGTSPLFILLLMLGGLYGSIQRLLWSMKRTS